ncbi:hypothetical protein BOTU111921_06215 [Bordetella tumbae]|uniref:hypothetical protein n=1 Tax=Bordetella tumbae TaxID=1649139 RepID=UPI0039F0FA7A
MKRSLACPIADVNLAQTAPQEDVIAVALQHTLSLQHIVASEAECAHIAKSLRRIAPPDSEVLPRKSA